MIPSVCKKYMSFLFVITLQAWDYVEFLFFRIGKGVCQVYCHPAYLIYMQSTFCEMQGWMKHKLESRLLGEISITSDKQMTPPLCKKAKRN